MRLTIPELYRILPCAEHIYIYININIYKFNTKDQFFSKDSLKNVLFVCVFPTNIHLSNRSVIRKSNGTGFYFKLSVSQSFVKTNVIGYMQISSGVTRQVRRPFRVKSLFLV